MTPVSVRTRPLRVLLLTLGLLVASCSRDTLGPELLTDVQPQFASHDPGEIWIGAGDIAWDEPISAWGDQNRPGSALLPCQ